MVNGVEVLVPKEFSAVHLYSPNKPRLTLASQINDAWSSTSIVTVFITVGGEPDFMKVTMVEPHVFTTQLTGRNCFRKVKL